MSKYTTDYARLGHTAKLSYSELRKAGLCTGCRTPSATARCETCAARLQSNRVVQTSTVRSLGAFLVCCQTSGSHRFDCREAPVQKRGAGPLLPMVGGAA